MRPIQAQDWTTTEWLNSERPLRLDDLRGRVVVLYAFQMLCPGCASQALPQARRVHETFRADDVAVIGLHTVFEHHEGNSPAALKAFLHEYGLAFPVGIDAPGEGSPIPRTMSAYAMQGTPTLILIDREGRLRRQTFGHLPDLQLGAEIMSLAQEPKSSS
ncbi:peroxiredoxin family protein [Sphingosinicella humi]|uniref:Alkyl hydroperoxide reductase n=1 Tax=Allosphingosinicella humi TaxID=2068657 RepID=A0A2U2IZJ3_9SPHN|nr:TlpA disulfide reductase family protein [Sphingosinicella humi]PWG01515.1 alkyl hydroperoxide reductase [Sphingosinicella humi]